MTVSQKFILNRISKQRFNVAISTLEINNPNPRIMVLYVLYYIEPFPFQMVNEHRRTREHVINLQEVIPKD